MIGVDAAANGAYEVMHQGKGKFRNQCAICTPEKVPHPVYYFVGIKAGSIACCSPGNVPQATKIH